MTPVAAPSTDAAGHPPARQDDAQGQGQGQDGAAPATAADQRPGLTPETLDFASRMFDLARAGDLKLIHYLAAGLPPNLTNQRGDSLLMLAAYHGHEDLVKAMLGNPPPSSAATSRTTSASTPSDADADVSAQSEQQQQESVEHAIPTLPPNRQPDVNQLNAKGQSILAGTVFKTYPAVAALLVQAGADPLAGEPSAEDTAKMFNKWEDGPLETGYRALFENAPGRGKGGVPVKEGMAPVSS
ncbi:hypothetical protein OC835_007008 [Tilletia horrida]|nr:hypothetical protein OC835_007008 [Tilletia horrida]